MAHKKVTIDLELETTFDNNRIEALINFALGYEFGKYNKNYFKKIKETLVTIETLNP